MRGRAGLGWNLPMAGGELPVEDRAERSSAARIAISMAAVILCAPLQARAAQVIATITGTVASGGTDVYGNVFSSTGATTDLSGDPFTLTYTIDDTKGVETAAGSPPGYSCIRNPSDYTCGGNITRTAAGDPITAVLTINGHSVSYGTLPSTGLLSEVSRQVNSGPLAYFHISESYAVSGTNISGSGFIAAYTYFTNPPYKGQPYSMSYNWETAIPYYSVVPNDNALGSFGFAHSYRDSKTGNPYGSQNSNGSLVLKTIAISGPITPPSTPHIYFLDTASGKFIDITNRAVPVVVGQKIQLFAEPAAIPGHPYAWDVAGNLVGDYLLIPQIKDSDPVPPCAQITKSDLGCAETTTPDFTQSSTTFYWTSQNTYDVSYSFSENGMKSLSSAKTRFYVTGPRDIDVLPTIIGAGQVYDNTARPLRYPDYPPTWLLSCGVPEQYAKSPCVKFLVSGSAPAGGFFQWVQLIHVSSSTAYPKQGKAATCNVSPGLDNNYPYGVKFGLINQPYTIDSPAVELDSNSEVLSISTLQSFDMYLEWNSGLPGSVPVPLGYISWAWTDSAQQKQGGTWELTSKTSNKPSFAAFVGTDPTYPQWTRVVSNSSCDAIP